MRGAVRGPGGAPLPGARVEVWQSDEDGLYDVQHAGLGHAQARGVVHADGEGRYAFRSILAVPYAIPHDGPVGELLRAAGRHPWRPAHLHFLIEAEGHETLVTHVFRGDDPHLDADAVFGVRESLIADWRPQDDGSYLVEYDFVLAPAGPGAGAAAPGFRAHAGGAVTGEAPAGVASSPPGRQAPGPACPPARAP